MKLRKETNNMSKPHLAIQNQAVKYAQKDMNGDDININELEGKITDNNLYDCVYIELRCDISNPKSGGTNWYSLIIKDYYFVPKGEIDKYAPGPGEEPDENFWNLILKTIATKNVALNTNYQKGWLAEGWYNNDNHTLIITTGDNENDDIIVNHESILENFSSIVVAKNFGTDKEEKFVDY